MASFVGLVLFIVTFLVVMFIAQCIRYAQKDEEIMKELEMEETPKKKDKLKEGGVYYIIRAVEDKEEYLRAIKGSQIYFEREMSVMCNQVRRQMMADRKAILNDENA